MALLCPSLPCRALPCRALSLIREYSKPLTRPDWRKSKPIITIFKLYRKLYIRRNEEGTSERLIKAIDKLLTRIERTDWFWTYETIKNNGLDCYYLLHLSKYGYEQNINVRDIDGINFARRWHISRLKHKCSPTYKNLIKLRN